MKFQAFILMIKNEVIFTDPVRDTSLFLEHIFRL